MEPAGKGDHLQGDRFLEYPGQGDLDQVVDPEVASTVRIGANCS